MPQAKLTKSEINQITASNRDQIFWDTELTGLGLKVTPKGRKSFLVQYRLGGRGTPTKKVKIGDYGRITLQQARKEARRILGEVASGNDPASKRQLERKKLGSDRVSDLLDGFLEQHASQNRSYKHIKYVLVPNFGNLFGNKSIHEINRRLINDMLDQVKARGSHTLANRVLANVRKFFNWCVSRGVIETNPCIGISAPTKEASRDRCLTDEELRLVIQSAREDGYPYGNIIEALVLTAQRRGEVVGMMWDEVDIDNQTWTVPAQRSKNGKAHKVHLSGQMIELLGRCPNAGQLVFTSNGKTMFSGFSRAKRRLDMRSSVSSWRVHDLRRTFTTKLADLKIPPHIADKVLNHQSGTISGVAAVYQRHEFLSERKAALDAWGNYVQSLLSGSKPDNVVHIGGR